MPVANHIKFFSKPAEEGEAVICRPYSPITPINTKGYIDFVIKCYPRTEEFPAGGKMGHYLRTLNVGDTMTCEGPIGMCQYKGDGVFNHKRRGDKRATKIGLIAGGSGITPVFNILDAIYRAKETHIDVKMLYTNKTRDDILIKDKLDAIANDETCTNIQISHTITRE